MTQYVMARAANKRPTLQHICEAAGDTETLCGTDMSGWSRLWMNRRVSLLLCRRCAKMKGIKLDV